jgi:hypothetical protein
MDKVNDLIPEPTHEELLSLQVKTRAEGKCGSLQTQTGLPCRRNPQPGFTVCWRHGARAPQTIKKAERLLSIARLPAINNLTDILDQAQENQCEHCGYPKWGETDYARMIAQTSKIVLDRTGLGPRATLDVNARVGADDTGDLIEQMTEEERELAASLLAQLRLLKDQVRHRMVKVPTAQAVEPVGLLQGVVEGVVNSEG